MIEKHDSNTHLFQETEEVKEKYNGNEVFKFYHKYLRHQIDKIMERKHN